MQTNFSKWLCSFMERNDIDVETLANTTGVSRKDVRNWMRAKSVPKTVYYLFLLKALSKLTACEENILYKCSSRAILKDS